MLLYLVMNYLIDQLANRFENTLLKTDGKKQPNDSDEREVCIFPGKLFIFFENVKILNIP